MKFCFYSKNDPNQEAVGATDALNREEALKYFALVKMMSLTDFQTIYNVKEYTYEESNKNSSKQLLRG